VTEHDNPPGVGVPARAREEGVVASPHPSAEERAVLHRDLAHLLTNLSIALHRHAMYPPGHPSLVPVLETLARRLHSLLGDRPRVAVGVARDQLVIEGVASDPRHPLLRGLAERLHRHHLAVLEFERGLTTDELLAVVEALSTDPEHGDGPLGSRVRAHNEKWPHVGMHPLSVEGLSIVRDDGTGHGPIGRDDAAARCTQLWIGLANAALERARGDTESEGLLGEPAVVARAIDEHQRVEAYDQVVVGYLLQIAEELRASKGQDAEELRRRTAQLMGALHPETLRRLLDMGGDALQRRRFVADVATGMAASAVVDVVEAAAAAAHETLSSGLLRLLSKLAAHAELGAERVRPLADTELREQVQRLIGGWELADPHPDDYRAALEHLAHTVPVDLEPTPDDEIGLALRVVQMSLEVEEDSPSLGRAVETLVVAGRVAPLLDVLRGPDAGSFATRLVGRLSSARTVRALLDRPKPDFAGLGALLPLLGPQAFVPVFETLTESDDRQHRRAAFDLLRRAGVEVLPMVRERLSDPRWYVIRNLLALVVHMEPVPEDLDPSPWLEHEDGRVRREALRFALRLPRQRGEALEAALLDPDPSVLGIALASAHEGCPPGAVPAVIAIAASERADDDLRASAMRALGSVRDDPRVLDLLLQAAARDSRRLPWTSAPPHSATALAALGSLAAAWGQDRRAAGLLRRARKSWDPQIRRAAGGTA
jgi:hypothetical protein